MKVKIDKPGYGVKTPKGKPKFDPASMNGTYKLQGDDTITIQWYEGCQMFYAIINYDPAGQTSFNLAGMKKFLKKYSPGYGVKK